MSKHAPSTAHHAAPSSHRTAQRIFLAGVAGVGIVVFGYLAIVAGRNGDNQADAAPRQWRLQDIPFDGAQAYEYLKQLCAIGPRPSGSPGMAAQRQLIVEHFRKLGAQVDLQEFPYPHPQTGTPVTIGNIIVRWHPQRAERILFCTHYDTLPLPLRDPRNPRGRFVGANDGGSGVALLMAMGHRMADLRSPLGVDFVFFDAEEFMYDEHGKFFVGSEEFARRYVQEKPPYRYRWGVLLDMVGDADLQLFKERNSATWPETRPLVDQIWATARKLGVAEFIPRVKHTVTDDHVALYQIGGIPACDLIDFDYPYWHTEGDTPEHCSALSLAKVGWVLWEWLGSQQ